MIAHSLSLVTLTHTSSASSVISQQIQPTASKMSGASNDSNMKQPKAKLRKRWVDSELEEVKSLRKKGASHGDIALVSLGGVRLLTMF